MTFRALVVEEEEQGQKSASVQILEDDRLPEGTSRSRSSIRR
jgi:hypothetical protein